MRILGLHGYQTSSKIFVIQSNYLRKILDKHHDIEWIIPDAPNISEEEISPLVTKYFEPPYYQWYTKKNYHGIKKSIKYIKSLGKIDGIIGFSQGGCFGYILSSILKPKFIISICGVNSINDDYKKFCNISSLHIIGENDEHRKRSEELTKDFLNPKIIYHSGKHTFPPNREIYNDILKFINIRVEE